MDFEPVLATTAIESSDPEVQAVGRMTRGLQLGKHSATSTAGQELTSSESDKLTTSPGGSHKFKDSAMSTASPELTSSESDKLSAPPGGSHKFKHSATSTSSPESSSELTSSESDKLSAPPGAPIYTTGTITSTWPTNFTNVTARTKHGSFSANNPNHESNFNAPLNLLNHAVRDGGLNAGTNSMSDADGGTPRQRVSFVNTAGSGTTTTRSVGQAFSQLQARGSEPIPSSPAFRTSDCHSLNSQTGPNININLPSRSPSPSHSPSWPRAASPLPEKSWPWFYPSSSSPLDVETGACPGPDSISGPGTSSFPSFNSSSNGPYNRGDPNFQFINITSNKSFCEAARLFVSDTLPRQVYHNFLLLSLPAMYSSRVARMVELDLNSQRGGGGRVNSASETPFNSGPGEWVSGGYPPGFSGRQGTGVSGAAANGFDSSHAFIDSLLREWKTLNVLSALLISTLVATLQIPEASDDPITRSTALLSLMCALMSLSYGCIYIMWFGTMRSMYRASRWAKEARRTNTAIWWNIWVLLAMPAVSMSWSMLLFFASILSFVWLTGSRNDPSPRAPLSATAILGSRVAITGVLVLGLVYLAMILKTLMREWGEMRADADVEMEIGMNLGAASVQEGGELGERGRESRERDRGRDGERSTRRRGGGADCHVDEEG